MYKIIDYNTGKQILEVYYSERDAKHARDVYLNECLRDNIIHNNLLLIEKYET